jgi:hypothetical protein
MVDGNNREETSAYSDGIIIAFADLLIRDALKVPTSSNSPLHLDL